MLPNILRCMKPFEHRDAETSKERKSREYEWLRKLSDYATYSQARGTCLLSGQQDLVDVSSNHKTSATLFSSVNMLYIVLIVSWISASFSLFCEGDILLGYEDIFVGIGLIWNLALVVISLLPPWYNDYNIPLNNTIIGIVLLGTSIAVQCVWSLSVKKPGQDNKPGDNTQRAMYVALFKGKLLRTNGFFTESVRT